MRLCRVTTRRYARSVVLQAWSQFNLAIAGAAAALAGLLIVALSVNVRKILANPTLPARAAASIAALVLTVLACGVGLIPDQGLWLIGVELAVPTALVVVLAVFAVRRIAVEPDVRGHDRVIKGVTVVLAPATFAVGVVLLACGVPAFGVIAAACLVAICAAVLFSWIALVEVLR